MKVLLAIDGSPHSQAAIAAVIIGIMSSNSRNGERQRERPCVELLKVCAATPTRRFPELYWSP